MTATEQLRALVRAELDRTIWTQEAVAAALGCSPKHLSQLLKGHVTLTVEWAEKILNVLGRTLTFGTTPSADGQP